MKNIKKVEVEDSIIKDKVRPFLKDIVNDLKISDAPKIQLKIAVNFMSSKEADEERVMYSEISNIEIMVNDKTSEVIKELFSITSFQVLNWVGSINER